MQSLFYSYDKADKATLIFTVYLCAICSEFGNNCIAGFEVDFWTGLPVGCPAGLAIMDLQTRSTMVSGINVSFGEIFDRIL